MTKIIVLTVGLFMPPAVAGCATPKIGSNKFVAPSTVVIDDIPDINLIATIGHVVVNWPAFYFSPEIDGFFIANGIAPRQAGVADNIVQIDQIVTNQIQKSPRHAGQAAASVAGGVAAGVDSF